MRTISPNTRRLINQLYEPASFWERLSQSRKAAATITEIGNSAEPATIIDILPFVLADRKEVAIAAAAAVRKLIESASPTDLLGLDRLSRERSPYVGNYRLDWYRLLPQDLNRLQTFGEASGALLGMASFHHSGYVREEAVKRLNRITTGIEIPFLLIRLDDWVSIVRDAAQKAINSRLNPAYCGSFITNLALIARLEATAKAHSETIIKGIKELLQSAECQSGLTEALSSNDRFIRRASFRLAINSKGRNLSEVLRQALKDNDAVIRLWAAQSVSVAFEGAALDQMLTLMKLDRFMPVRREALRICVRRRPDQTCGELRSALLDRHASIREEARYHLPRFDSLDVALFYRQSLSAADERNLSSAISGLGETGVAEDGDLLIPYASHDAAKIRRATIRALTRLNSLARLDVLIQALMDQFPSVSREALKGLTDKATLIGKGRLLEIFSSSSYGHVKRNALSLLEKIGKWDSIYLLVKSTSESDQSVASRVLIAIDRWLWRFNRTFPVPTPDQLTKLSSALNECGDHLDEKTREQLWFCMKGF